MLLYNHNETKITAHFIESTEDGMIDGNYETLAKVLEEVEATGYTFEYYLDGIAYDLRKIGQKGKAGIECEILNQ